MGQLVYQFLTKLDWFSTLFPRIPVPIQKQIERKIEQYCRENNVTVHKLSAGPNKIAGPNSRANRGDFNAEDEGNSEVRERWRNKIIVTNYKGEHDDRGEYRQSSSRDYREQRDHKSKRYDERSSSTESIYRGTSGERERYSEKRKKKRKHKRYTRSRSRSRSHSRTRTRSKRKRNERDRDRHPHRTKSYSDGHSEDKRYR